MIATPLSTFKTESPVTVKVEVIASVKDPPFKVRRRLAAMLSPVNSTPSASVICTLPPSTVSEPNEIVPSKAMEESSTEFKDVNPLTERFEPVASVIDPVVVINSRLLATLVPLKITPLVSVIETTPPFTVRVLSATVPFKVMALPAELKSESPEMEMFPEFVIAPVEAIVRFWPTDTVPRSIALASLIVTSEAESVAVTLTAPEKSLLRLVKIMLSSVPLVLTNRVVLSASILPD